MNRVRLLALGLLVLGLLEMVAHLTGVETLREVAIATAASPEPCAFSAAQRLEALRVNDPEHPCDW